MLQLKFILVLITFKLSTRLSFKTIITKYFFVKQKVHEIQ